MTATLFAEPALDSAINASSVPATATIASASGAKIFDIDCKLNYQLTGPTDFLFQLHAMNAHDQVVLSESLTLTPPLSPHLYEDPTVHHRFTRLHAPAGPLEVHYQARVQRTPLEVDTQAGETPIADLPDELMHNLMPTRYCESDLMFRTAFKLFGHLQPGHGRVQAIADWIHDNIDYQLGSSQATTTARDVYLQRAGVCRDFAHLGVTFCRALNIPARLVVGYARFSEPPPDFHAIFEAYLGKAWVMFDPTRMSPVNELVRIARGRDAKDVAFATIFGPAQMMGMNPRIQEAPAND